jgi:uncharacterized protein (TIGR03085 family)
MPGLAQRERRALADLLASVGPDAPTLCEGWTTRDLAAHLVARDRRLDSLPGLMVPVLSGYTERVRVSTRDHRDYERLVELVRSGPLPPVRVPAVDGMVNGLEYLVHHEDVVRAQPDWKPIVDAERDDEAWGRLRTMAKLIGRPVGVGLVLASPDRESITAKAADGGGDRVSGTVTGPVVDVVLWAFGRTRVADVEFSGDYQAVTELRATHLGS